jgi:ribosome-associated translation inhibitor RaiA
MAGRTPISTARRGTSPDGSKEERRKNQRFPVTVPIEASWRGPDGRAIKEQAVARQANANGGMLEMSTYPEVGSRISLTNFLSAETAEARVLASPFSRDGISHGIVVELIVPSESFWGVNLQVKKTSVELQKLEQSLRSEGIDLRVLNEFRDAVDYVRTAAVVVQQLRELQMHGRDDGEVTSLLTAERIRRTTNLCQEVIADLDAEKISAGAKGVDDLYNALEQACDRLRHLIKSREPHRYLTGRT